MTVTELLRWVWFPLLSMKEAALPLGTMMWPSEPVADSSDVRLNDLSGIIM